MFYRLPSSVKYLVFLSLGIFSGTFIARTFLDSTSLSSGTSEIVKALNPATIKKLNDDADKLNRLVAASKYGESVNTENVFNKKLEYNRQTISKIYLNMASTISNDRDYNHPEKFKIVPFADELVAGLKARSIDVTDPNYELYEYHPQNNSFWSLGTSELVNSMRGESREKILSKSQELNTLVRKYSSMGKDFEEKMSLYQKIVKLYADIHDILSNNVTDIQISNPRMTTTTRIIISGLKDYASKKYNTSFVPTEFHPEKIRYKSN